MILKSGLIRKNKHQTVSRSKNGGKKLMNNCHFLGQFLLPLRVVGVTIVTKTPPSCILSEGGVLE